MTHNNQKQEELRNWAQEKLASFVERAILAESVSKSLEPLITDTDGLVGHVQFVDTDGRIVGFNIPLVNSDGVRRDVDRTTSFASVYVDEKLRTRPKVERGSEIPTQWFEL